MEKDSTLCLVFTAVGIRDMSVLAKTKEVLRLLNMRMPCGALKKAEVCRHIIAIEIACRLLNVSFDKNKLVLQSTLKMKSYQEALISCKNVLKVKWQTANIMDVLSVQFGVQHKTAAYSLLDKYQTEYVDKLNTNRQSFVDISSPVYQAAAYYIASKSQKVFIIN